MKQRPIDRPFFIIVLLLVVFGFIVFFSASLGLLTKQGGDFELVALKQLLFGLVGGGILMFFFSRFHYALLKKYSLYFFILAIVLTAAVLIPHIGFEHGGARRWLSLGMFTFQPSELLRVSFVIYFAAWLSAVKDRAKNFKYGLLPLCILLGVSGVLLLLEPDTDTFLTLALALFAMFMVAGGRLRDMLLLSVAGLGSGALLVIVRPYLRARLMTFLNLQGVDYYGAGYQVYQALIALGSGGIFGRGFGQSVQKFGYLPEPMGDSIFAVAGEEFGFIGASALIILFVLFAMRGLRIAGKSPDLFGGLLGLGIVILIVSQTFLNIASMLALFPLSGTPLIFVSQGGTSLLIALAEVGILLNISRYQKS